MNKYRKKLRSIPLATDSSGKPMDSYPEFFDSSDSDDASVNAEKRQTQRANKRALRERLNRTLFVGNLPTNVSRRRIDQLFSGHLKKDPICAEEECKVESVRLRGLVPGTGGSGRLARKRAAIQGETSAAVSTSILGYVVLTSEVGIQSALSLNGTFVEGDLPQTDDALKESGRYIRVDRGSRKSPSDNPKRCVFLGNLPFDVLEDEVRSSLSMFGEIESVRLIRDKQTGAVKGFGFVQYTDESSVALAIRGNETVSIRSRPVRIQAWQADGHALVKTKPSKKRKPPKVSQEESPATTTTTHVKKLKQINKVGQLKGITLPSNKRGSQRTQFLKKRLMKKKIRANRRALETKVSKTTKHT